MKMKATETKIESGDLVCCVARDGSRQASCGGGFSRPIWTGAIYEAKARKSDGVLTWRRVDDFGGTRSGDRPSNKFHDELTESAPHEWRTVRHGQLCNDRE